MSKHPSFGKSSKGMKKRNVLKRFERVRVMLEKDQWKDRSSVFGLPKTKPIG